MVEKEEKSEKNNYPYTDNVFSNTADIKINGVEKLLGEKISNLKERVEKLENKELKRDDRKFQWLTLVLGAILGTAFTIVTQAIIKIINKF